jgi:hypothetical protein
MKVILLLAFMFAKLYYNKLPVGKTNAVLFKKYVPFFRLFPSEITCFGGASVINWSCQTSRKHIQDKKEEWLCNAVTKTILVLFTMRSNWPLPYFTNLKRTLCFPLAALRPDFGPFPSCTGFREHSLDTPHSVRLLWTTDRPVAETSS